MKKVILSVIVALLIIPIIASASVTTYECDETYDSPNPDPRGPRSILPVLLEINKYAGRFTDTFGNSTDLGEARYDKKGDLYYLSIDGKARYDIIVNEKGESRIKNGYVGSNKSVVYNNCTVTEPEFK